MEDESANNQWPDIRAENLGVVTRMNATPPTGFWTFSDGGASSVAGTGDLGLESSG